MSEQLAFEIYYIELWHIFSVLFFVVINFYIYLNARKNTLLYSYLVVEALLLIWLVSKILKTVSPTVDIRWFFIVTQYFGNCFLGSAFFAFAYTYAKGKLPNKQILIGTNLPSLFFFLCMATNPYHMQFYSYYDFYRDSFGPLFYVHQVYTYSLMFLGIYFCSKQFFIEFHHKRKQAIVISAAVLIPLAINIFYILKLYKLLFGFRPLFDITPIACNLSLLLFAIATFRFRFFDITPIAWRKVFDQIPDGVILLNKDRIISDRNYASETTAETQEIISKASELNLQSENFEFLHTASTGKQFKVSWASLYEKSRKKGYVLRFADDTLYQHTLQTLSDKNQVLQNLYRILQVKASNKQTLAVYKTRNFIGREVHDILGHSIVLVLSLLEVARLSLNNNIDVSKEKLMQAIMVIQSSKEQMNQDLCLPSQKAKDQKSIIINDLKKIADDICFAGHDLTLTIQGESSELPHQISEAVIRLCQEAITNAIRHGKAEKINIILRFSVNQLEIYILDNGIGCSDIKKGFGLLGMEERIVSDLKGVLNFGSLEGGFTIRAVIPLNFVK
ncbi:MAG: hypothetical protein KA282_02945 [Clostridia bacterium]|nr:hypothetical protein [Clostridia bacterium]